MKARLKRLWIVTTANIIVAGLLLLVLYGIMLALAVLAPEIVEWPLYLLLLMGMALSIAGLWFTKGVVSRASKRIALVVNGCVLVFALMIIFGLAAIYFGSSKERFLIPEGYRGDVYIVYGALDGATLNQTRSGITYPIPENGVLRVNGTMIRNSTRTEYYYQLRTGRLQPIRNIWPTTIHRTPENLANDNDSGIFFPRTGSSTDAAGCTIEFEQFYVGTKAHLLTNYKPLDLFQYLRAHPVRCTAKLK